MSHELPLNSLDQKDNSENHDAPADILTLVITEETADRVYDAIHGVEDQNPAPQIASNDISAFARHLRTIFDIAYNAHFSASRELATELDKLLRGIEASKSPEELENWTAPERFDHFAELFQAAALEIWLLTKREIDHRDFRVTIAESFLQSFPVVKALAKHIRSEKSTFDKFKPSNQKLWLKLHDEELVRTIRLEYYKYFHKRSDQLPDKTIVSAIAAAYDGLFNERFIVSEINQEARRSDINRFNDGFPIRFACAVIRELKLHLLMAPIVPRKRVSEPEENVALKKNTELHALSPSVAPKHRSYDQFGNPLTVDVEAPFPWSLTKTQKESFRDRQNNTWALPSDDWELVKNRIGDSWTNK